MKRIITLCILALLFQALHAQKGTAKTTSTTASILPFVGKRWFNTDKGNTGTGTPQYYMEIKSTGDVYFGYTQNNQATNKEKNEQVPAGKFKTYLKAYFKGLDERHYYKVVGNSIYEVDQNNQIINSLSCCDVSVENNTDAGCECKGEFINNH